MSFVLLPRRTGMTEKKAHGMVGGAWDGSGVLGVEDICSQGQVSASETRNGFIPLQHVLRGP